MFGKLGCLPPKRDYRMLRFARYLVPGKIAPPPKSVNWSKAADKNWHTYRNLDFGCCVFASMGHAVQAWSANASREYEMTDADVVGAYSAVTGFDPRTGANDNGTVVVDGLNYWRKTGVGGNKLGAYVAVTPSSIREVQEAMHLFGGVYLGVALPLAAQEQKVWSAPPRRFVSRFVPAWEPNSWGGHAIFAVDYDQNFVTVVTWGELKKMTWEFFIAYVQEAYALLSPSWFNNKRKAPNGFAVEELVRDLAVLGRLRAPY